MTLSRDYTLDEIAEAVQMSTRWVRQQIADGAEHIRYGHKIRMTQAQIDKLRADHTRQAPAKSVTTGRKRKSA